MTLSKLTTALAMVIGCSPLWAAGIAGDVERDDKQSIEETLVSGKTTGLRGDAESASVGTVLSEQLTHRPVLRPAEVLETIPGMVVTQHSGAGKANQYFLRGFNLDHSTDFANHVEGVPINLVSHGHGQGYTDLNFLIPELIDRMVYKKGPYYASEGDFSSAGSAHIEYANGRDKNLIQLTAGEYNYQRALAIGSSAVAGGDLLVAVESLTNDGPWEVEDNFDKINAVVKYSQGDAKKGSAFTAMAYKSDWTGTDQIPTHLVQNGTIGRYASLDPTTGGETHRNSLSAKTWGELSESSRYEASVYGVDYGLQLASNFTYQLNDAGRGDQILQFDDRRYYGGDFALEHSLITNHELTVGADWRYDEIGSVGVAQSQARVIHTELARASVEEGAYAVYTDLHSDWTPWLATTIGIRHQAMQVDVVDQLNAEGTGKESEHILSPSASLRVGPFAETELFLNYGEGFHSNDARGVVADSGVPLLSKTRGYEAGFRSALIPNLQLSMALFRLDLDSELVFVGDDGTTEPKGATKRTGVELGMFYQPASWLMVDADYAASTARFKDLQRDDNDVVIGRAVPDSIDTVFSIGVSAELKSGFHSGLRVRHFGPRNLTEAGDVKSKSTTVVNLNSGYALASGIAVDVELLNVFDAKDDDITYFYESQAPEQDAFEGLHSHPVVPRSLRVSLSYEF